MIAPQYSTTTVMLNEVMYLPSPMPIIMYYVSYAQGRLQRASTAAYPLAVHADT